MEKQVRLNSFNNNIEYLPANREAKDFERYLVIAIKDHHGWRKENPSRPNPYEKLIQAIHNKAKESPQRAPIDHLLGDIDFLYDYIGEFLRDELSMPFEFAKNLNRLDFIHPNCLTSETEEGKTLIQLLADLHLSFVVKMKNWLTPESLQIDYRVCHEDYDYDLLDEMIKGAKHAE